ncbi:hypothetical protein MXB_5244, partial [Myxobolus squamalis]
MVIRVQSSNFNQTLNAKKIFNVKLLHKTDRLCYGKKPKFQIYVDSDKVILTLILLNQDVVVGTTLYSPISNPHKYFLNILNTSLNLEKIEIEFISPEWTNHNNPKLPVPTRIDCKDRSFIPITLIFIESRFCIVNTN